MRLRAPPVSHKFSPFRALLRKPQYSAQLRGFTTRAFSLSQRQSAESLN